MKAGVHPGACPGQGALRRRPRGRCHRRDAECRPRTRAEQVSVDYETLPAVTDLASAQNAGQPQIHAEAANNTVYQWHLGDKAAVAAAFASAKHVTKIDLINNRLIPNADRAARGDWRLRRRATTASRSTPPARTRT